MCSADVTGQKEPLKYAFTQSPAAWLWRMWECELRAQDCLASILPSRDSVCFFCPHPTPTGFCPNKECFCTLENIRKSVIGRAERLAEPVRYREPFRTILQAQGSVTLDSGQWLLERGRKPRGVCQPSGEARARMGFPSHGAALQQSPLVTGGRRPLCCTGAGG